MFTKRITTLLVFTALLFAPSILAKPMPATPSGLAARASHKHVGAAKYSTKLRSTYKGNHVGAAKRATKATSVAHLLQKRQDDEADDAALAVADTVGNAITTVEDADPSAEASAVDGEDATPSRRQDTLDNDTTEPAAEDTSNSAADVEDSIATTETAALKRRQDVAEGAAAENAIEVVDDNATSAEGSASGAEDDVNGPDEATLEERQSSDVGVSNTNGVNNTNGDTERVDVDGDVGGVITGTKGHADDTKASVLDKFGELGSNTGKVEDNVATSASTSYTNLHKQIDEAVRGLFTVLAQLFAEGSEDFSNDRNAAPLVNNGDIHDTLNGKAITDAAIGTGNSI